MKSKSKLLFVISFAMAALMLATPASAVRSKYFSDVGAELTWASDAVDSLYEAYVIKGTGDGTFLPMGEITRADFILMLVRAFDLEGGSQENFSDVTLGSYYYNAVNTAKAQGIALGNGGNFNPSAGISRQDAMVLVSRTLKTLNLEITAEGLGSIRDYKDVALVSDYALEAVTEMVESGMIQGTSGFVNPKGTMSRAEMAVFLNRVLEACGKMPASENFTRGVDERVLETLNLTADQGYDIQTVLEYVSRAMLESQFTIIDGTPSLKTATNVLYAVVEGRLFEGLVYTDTAAVAVNEQLGEIYRAVFAVADLEKDASGCYQLDTEACGGTITRDGENIAFVLPFECDTTVQVQVYYGEAISGGAKIWCKLYTTANHGAEAAYYGKALVYLKSGDGLAGGYLVDSFELYREAE